MASLLSIKFYIFLCCVGARTQIEAGCTNTKMGRGVFVQTMVERSSVARLQWQDWDENGMKEGSGSRSPRCAEEDLGLGGKCACYEYACEQVTRVLTTCLR